jgi:hypothetical protein
MEKTKFGIHDSRKTTIKSNSSLIIHDSRNKKVYNLTFYKKIRLFYDNNKITIRNIIIFLIISVIVLFPTWAGTLLGVWFKNFIGTFLNIISSI